MIASHPVEFSCLGKDLVSHAHVGAAEVHHKVPGLLCCPGAGGVRSGAQDPDPAAGVFDHREDVDGGAVEVQAVKKSTARMAADGGRGARDNDAGEFACMRR